MRAVVTIDWKADAPQENNLLQANFDSAGAPAEASRVAGERAQVMLDSIGDAVLSTDLAGNVTYMNPVAERMTGWSTWEATGRPLAEVHADHRRGQS